jgi:trans-aconitate 2-methyltransferase
VAKIIQKIDEKFYSDRFKSKMPMQNIEAKLSEAKNYVPTSCWNGDFYTHHSEWQFRMAMKALRLIQIPNKASLLDIGCGNGRITHHLATSIPDGTVSGIDPSSSMIETAQKLQLPNLSFALGKAETLGFENRFDRIVAFNSLHWVSEIELALERIRHALKPGGQALILVAPIQVRHPLHQIIDSVAKTERWRPYFGSVASVFSFYTLADWASLVERADLIPESLQHIDASMDYPDKKAFADSLVGWVPFGSIPESLKAQYIDDIVKAYVAAIPCKPNGAVPYCLDELVIVASKRTQSL